MQRIWSIALPILLVSICGCGEVRESWEACSEAARDLHRGDAQALCRRFSETMVSALPCHAMERVLRQTVGAVGEPVGECRWAYTYRIQSLDPLRAVAVYKCPFEHEAVRVTVAVQVTDGGAEITGLWTDSPRIRSSRLLIKFEMCQKLDERRNACIGPVSKVAWSEPRISVWNQWQNLRGGDEVAWSWVAPDGTNVSRFAHQVEESPPFDYRTWSYIEPAELKVESPYGTWTVTVGLNDEERETLRFEIVREGAED
jgi:hypothetical protein